MPINYDMQRKGYVIYAHFRFLQKPIARNMRDYGENTREKRKDGNRGNLVDEDALQKIGGCNERLPPVQERL